MSDSQESYKAMMARSRAPAPKKVINVEMTLDEARRFSATHQSTWTQLQNNKNDLAQVDKPVESPHVLVDAVSAGGPVDGKSKPCVRHVIIKDLYKIGQRLKYRFPRGGVFKDQAPIGLYALFDGQSCAGDPGPVAAEFCARNFHTVLLERLSALPEAADKSAITSALEKAFADLEEQILNNHLEIHDGCGASVVLLVGEHLFTALLGQCSAVLCRVTDGASRAWSFRDECNRVLAGDALSLKPIASSLIEDASGVGILHPSGKISRVSRSLGDRMWKQSPDLQQPLVFCTPEVGAIELKGVQDPFLLLVASSVLSRMNPQELVDIAKEYPLQPRAACGEITARALQASMAAGGEKAQCVTVAACFLPMDRRRFSSARPSEPAAKKAKVAGSASGSGTQSMRLRHILLSYSDASADSSKEAGGKGNGAKRTRQEAETLLRGAMSGLRAEMKNVKKLKDATEVVSKTTPKFTVLCRELSECETAKKGGMMCGELGWMTPEERGIYGAGFREVVDVLFPGELSDLAVSTCGLHLVQRMA